MILKWQAGREPCCHVEKLSDVNNEGLELETPTQLGAYLGCGQHETDTNMSMVHEKALLHQVLFSTPSKVDADYSRYMKEKDPDCMQFPQTSLAPLETKAFPATEIEEQDTDYGSDIQDADTDSDNRWHLLQKTS